MQSQITTAVLGIVCVAGAVVLARGLESWTAAPGSELTLAEVAPAGESTGSDAAFVLLETLELRTAASTAPVAAVSELPQAEIARLIRDLAHDTTRGNAHRALHRLRQRREALQPLRKALYSSDRQQRQLAAWLLWWIVDRPSARLLEVSVEGLHADRIPHDWQLRRSLNADNARSFVPQLLEHTGRAKPMLCAGLWSSDEQQRFFCAFLLAMGGHTEWLWRTTAILIPHLRDNNIGGDAMMCAHALYAVGRPVLPFVRAALHGADAQSTKLLRRIESNIVSPPTEHAIRARRDMRDITRIYHDPVIEYTFGKSRFVDLETGRSTLPPRWH